MTGDQAVCRVCGGVVFLVRGVWIHGTDHVAEPMDEPQTDIGPHVGEPGGGHRDW